MSNKVEYNIAKNYHENTKIHSDIYRRTQLLKRFPINTRYKEYDNPSIPLSNVCIDNEFAKIIVERRSIRDFKPVLLSFKDISTILYLSYGINLKNKYNLRMAPSAGARYPLEIYVVVFESNDLEQGIYHYNVKNNYLEFINNGDFKDYFYKYSIKQEMVLKSSVLIVLTGVFERTMDKYGERGYRYMLLDAGHVGQNIYLTSTYLGLACTSMGGFDDDKINNLLNIESSIETSLYMVAIGGKPEATIRGGRND